ncbi:MAG TPA: glutaredoxin domain-containing protein [Polyangiaceae bacterium]|nr:glutaredoxin domain-containing protein [Polyangiaceae bacterium]
MKVDRGRIGRVALRVALLVLVMGSSACRKSSSSAAPDPAATVVVRPESTGLLLTWIDDKGDFHVETAVTDVPIMGRDVVRVEDPARDESAHPDQVVVADLRQAGADGAFPVHTMSRADFEAMAVARREKTGPTMASAGPAQAPPGGGPPGDTANSKHAAKAAVVVIYGAEWCGACHEAAKYLRSKGIPYVDKDIEKDPDAAREMQQKLAKNGMHEGSIPVIDVRGKVMVGFNPAEIDAALGQAL